MIYREAHKTDLKGILDLYQQLNPEDSEISFKIASQIWDKIHLSSNHKYFVASEKDKIISSCNISIIPNLTRQGRSYAIIENVITDIDFRFMGVEIRFK